MNPATQAFIESALRHLLTGVGAVLIAHGYASPSVFAGFEQELIGAAIAALGLLWANRVTYWAAISQIVARSMSQRATAHDVAAKVAELHEAGALPSVFTRAEEIPSLVKP